MGVDLRPDLGGQQAQALTGVGAEHVPGQRGVQARLGIAVQALGDLLGVPGGGEALHQGVADAGGGGMHALGGDRAAHLAEPSLLSGAGIGLPKASRR